MEPLDEKFVMDENGERVGVILPMEDYRKILEELEELEVVRAYDEAKASGEEIIPFGKAVEEIEKGRR